MTAALVHFLASPMSRVLHGAVLDASMGLGVRPGSMSEQVGSFMSRADSGSSRSRMRGSGASARARATRCC